MEIRWLGEVCSALPSSVIGLLVPTKANAGAEVPVCQLGATSGLYVEGQGPRSEWNLLVG